MKVASTLQSTKNQNPTPTAAPDTQERIDRHLDQAHASLVNEPSTKPVMVAAPAPSPELADLRATLADVRSMLVELVTTVDDLRHAVRALPKPEQWEVANGRGVC